MNVKIETKPLVNYFEKLAQRWPKQMENIVRGEACKTIEMAIKKTKKAKVPTLERVGLLRGYKRHKRGDEILSINTGQRGGRKDLVWYSYNNSEGKRVFRPVGKWQGTTELPELFQSKSGNLDAARLANYRSLWSEASKDANTQKVRIKKARGSTAQSWLEIIRTIEPGYKAAMPSFITTAVRRDGKTGLGSAYVESKNGNFTLRIENRSGFAIKSGGDGLIKSCIYSRNLFWERAFKRGFVENAEFVTKYAPFIKIN